MLPPGEVRLMFMPCSTPLMCLFLASLHVNFLEYPDKEKPALLLSAIEPYRRAIIERYEILPLPVKHSVPTLGYQVTSSEGKALFYTGDTGSGISACWEYISPQLLITEVAGPNKFEDLAEPRWPSFS